MSAEGGPADARQPELAAALSSYRGVILGVGLMSGVINALYLTGSVFMLEVYDRVLPSHSVPTLVGLAAITAVLFLFQGVLDAIRARIFARLGAALDEALAGRVFDAVLQLRLRGAGGREGMQPLRDLEQVRAFLAGSGPGALFDLPWIPFYLSICFAFHWLIGLAALGGAILLGLMTAATEMLSRAPSRSASQAQAERNAFAESSRRNAETLVALGMSPALRERWRGANEAHGAAQQRSADIAGDLGATAKTLRMMLQSGVLGIGAYLVIHGEASAGIIIAASILTARALAPVDLAITHWKGLVAARQGWARLRRLLALTAPASEAMALPPPSGSLVVEDLCVAPPGAGRAVVQNIALTLQAGDTLAVIGPSGSGKSSLARALVGIWPPARGQVRIDGAALAQWPPAALGRHIGYLPQDIELFDGTVADNIARFSPSPDPEAVIAAARTAGIHELILRLPAGYDTRLGEAGQALSAGQRQRIALARALYGEPFLVVLDEPNSNLDAEGERALARAIAAVRDRRGIAVVVSHRPSALAAVDRVLLMVGGRTQAIGPRAQFLRPISANADAPEPAIAERAAS